MPHWVGVLHHLCVVLLVSETHRLVHHRGIIGDHIDVLVRRKIVAGGLDIGCRALGGVPVSLWCWVIV